MSNNIKQGIDKIVIPTELHTRSQMGIQQAKLELLELEGEQELEGARSVNPRFRWWTPRKTIAVLILVFILITTALVNTEVIAAIQKALQYFPGIGMVVEEDTPQDRYVLQNPVDTEIGRGILTIGGIFVDDEMTLINISGINTNKVSDIKVVNEQGVEFDMNNAGLTSTSSGEWAASFWHQGTLDLKGQIQVIIGENPVTVIPINLTKVKTFSSYQDMGETATVNDVTITAIANRIGERARISLVAQHPKEFTIRNYRIVAMPGEQKLNVVDETGKGYELEKYMGLSGISGPLGEFYYELSESSSTTYTITIPEINVNYTDKIKLSLDIPLEETKNVNKPFELAGFPGNITKLERIESNRLRMYVDLNYNEYAFQSLINFNINSSNTARINEQTRALEYIEFDIKPDSKVVKLELSDPEVVIHGPWKFNLPTEVYFNK